MSIHVPRHPGHHTPSPSAAASRAARERQRAGGPAGRWRAGRQPELHRCRLPDVTNARLTCDALIERERRAQHLADVHGRVGADADAEALKVAFVLVAAARTKSTWEWAGGR